LIGMSDVKTRPRPAAYDADFHAWTQDQAARLRELRPNSLDWENIAEEIETLGRSEKREVENRLGVLLLHLLKWARQPDRRKSGWRATIVEQRRQLLRTLGENPSLATYPYAVLADQYEVARLRAIDETGLEDVDFPEACPFTIEQVLDPAFWPDALEP
jgi:Domain of unknown function DUF29